MELTRPKAKADLIIRKGRRWVIALGLNVGAGAVALLALVPARLVDLAPNAFDLHPWIPFHALFSIHCFYFFPIVFKL